MGAKRFWIYTVGFYLAFVGLECAVYFGPEQLQGEPALAGWSLALSWLSSGAMLLLFIMAPVSMLLAWVLTWMQVVPYAYANLLTLPLSAVLWAMLLVRLSETRPVSS